MKIAIDKNIDIKKSKKGNDYIYVFDDNEKVSDLINKGSKAYNKKI